MRLLAWHCRSLSYTDARPSSRPVLTTEKGESREFSSILLVFVTVEAGDEAGDLGQPADDIIRLHAQLAPQNGIVLMPFAHLSNALAGPNEARAIISALGRRLKATAPTTMASFGFHKSIEISYSAYGHPGSVAFREFFH